MVQSTLINLVYLSSIPKNKITMLNKIYSRDIVGKHSLAIFGVSSASRQCISLPTNATKTTYSTNQTKAKCNYM